MTAGGELRGPVSGGIGLHLRLDPLRLLLSASPYRAAGFLLTYLLVSGVLFSIALAATVLSAVLACTIVAAPLLIAAAWVVHGCAALERLRLRQVLTEPVRASYPAPGRPSLWGRAKASWSAGATWRELGYLAGLWPLLLGLDAIVFAVWAGLLAGITFPAWYGRIGSACIGSCHGQSVPGLMIGHFPHGPHGPGARGFYADSLPAALLCAAVAGVLFLLFNYVLVATARLHAQVAVAVLRRPADPLAPARQVLASPGPLGSLTRAGP